MCDLNRRTFLRIGLGASALAPFGLAGAQDAARGATAKAVILLYMEGGPSHIDTFDPKPGRDTGGPFRAIETAVRGLHIGEHLSRMAKQAKHFSVIRSMTSREGDHERGQYALHTGYSPEGAVSHPSMGSYVSREIGDPKSDLPNYIAVRARVPGPAFLKAPHAPFCVDEPGQPVRNISYSAGVDVLRFNERMSILELIEKESAGVPGDIAGPRREIWRKADRLMHSAQLRAFNLDEEDDARRDAYGRNAFGRGCLLARRLVERGVRFVEVGLNGWDTHEDNFTRTRLTLDELDPAFAALIADLRDRRLLEETIVLCAGEFGRTPTINAQNGRDHWPQAFSAVIAGGGVQGGRVIGETDAGGFEVKERPVTFEDLSATVYRCLGIDPRKHTMNEQGRPIRMLNGGTPVRELF